MGSSAAPIPAKAASSLASASMVAPARGCSSLSRRGLPSRSTTVNRLLAKRFSLIACSALCWLWRAKASQSARVKPSMVAMRSAEMPCGTWVSFCRRCMLLPSMPPPSEPIGTRDMLSTPPATTSSCWPDITPMAAKLNAWAPEPQKRFRVTPVAVSGQPAVSTALRPTLAPCSPTSLTQPTTTSSTSSVRRPVRRASWFRTWASSSWGCMLERAPLPALPRPRGVRTASRMKTSRMGDTSLSRAGV